jgi:hypothetical protein
VESVRILKPHGHLLRQGIIVTVAFMVPVFLVLYFLTVPSGWWRTIVAAQVISSLIVVLLAIALLRTKIWVSSTEIAERGFFGRMKRLSKSDIDSIMIVQMYAGSSTETSPQLFVRGQDGKQELRMRGQFWSLESMDTVIAVLGVPVDRVDENLSTDEVRDDYPGLLYWFERRPVVAAAVFTITAAIVVATFVLLFESGVLPILRVTPPTTD